MIVLVGAYHLFLQPFSGFPGAGKKRVPTEDTNSASDAVPSEQFPSPIEQVLIRVPFKPSVEYEAQNR